MLIENDYFSIRPVNVDVARVRSLTPREQPRGYRGILGTSRDGGGTNTIRFIAH